jgi:hypothetical protein
MEDNMEIHLKEVHLEEICLMDHHSIHLLDHFDGQHLTMHVYTTMVSTPYCTTCTKTNNQATIYKKLQYPTYVKDIDLDAHIIIFKKAIKANGKIVEVYIINLLEIIYLHGEKTLFKTIQIAHLKSWSKHFASDSKL